MCYQPLGRQNEISVLIDFSSKNTGSLTSFGQGKASQMFFSCLCHCLRKSSIKIGYRFLNVIYLKLSEIFGTVIRKCIFSYPKWYIIDHFLKLCGLFSEACTFPNSMTPQTTTTVKQCTICSWISV